MKAAWSVMPWRHALCMAGKNNIESHVKTSAILNSDNTLCVCIHVKYQTLLPVSNEQDDGVILGINSLYIISQALFLLQCKHEDKAVTPLIPKMYQSQPTPFNIDDIQVSAQQYSPAYSHRVSQQLQLCVFRGQIPYRSLSWTDISHYCARACPTYSTTKTLICSSK